MANYHHDHPHPMPLIIPPPPPPLPDSIHEFRPTQRECIIFLLQKFIDKPLPCSHIFDFDPYDPTQLPSLFMSAEHQEHLYLFTKLSKKGKSSSRRSGYKNANRIVGKGTWHCDQTGYVTHNGTKIGIIRTLSYREKGSVYDHRFQIHEYSLPENTPLRYNPLEDYVLCHLSRNDRWCNGKKVNPKKYYSCSSLNDVVMSNDSSTRSTCTADHNQAPAAPLFVRPLATMAPPAREPAAAHDDPVGASILDYDENQLVDFLTNQVDFDAEIQDMDVDGGGGNFKNNISSTQYDQDRPPAANQTLDFLTEEVDYI